MNPELDQDVVNLAKAIRQTESGGNFSAKGKSGEHGAYQFTPDTWNRTAPKYGISVPIEQATPEQQNAVAYNKIKEWKDSGRDVTQIASMWNAGEQEPDAYTGRFSNGKPATGTNKFGANYDVPKYAESVGKAYLTVKNGGEPTIDYNNPSSTTIPQETAQNPEEKQGLVSKLIGRGKNIGQEAQNKNPLKAGVRVSGEISRGLGDIASSAINQIPGVEAGLEKAGGVIGVGIKPLVESGVGQTVIGAAKEFASKNPETAQTIKDVASDVGLVSSLGAGGLVKNAIGKGLGKAVGKDAISVIANDVAPELTARTGAKAAAKQGLVKSLIRREITPVMEESTKDIAKTVADSIPNFSRLGTYTDKLNTTLETAYKMADDLKQQVIQQGSDRIYPFKELAKTFDDIKPSISIKSDATLARQFDLAKEAALETAKKSGGTISSLFDARKAFDDLVRKEFPTLYDRTNAPMRDAITSMRGAMNDFIESKLPEGSGFKDSLKTQSNLFRAAENLAPKAFSEVGTTGLQRFAGRHPLTSGLFKEGIKNAAKIGLTAAGIDYLSNR